MSIFLNAAYEILIDTDRPMSAEEITQKALERGLLVTRGATPVATMSASLYIDIKEKGVASRFIQVGPNRFTINEVSPQSLSDVKQKEKKVRKTPKQSVATSAHALLDTEIALIRTYLVGQSPNTPTSEKLCDWVTMCYAFGLYSEGIELLGYIDPQEVNEWYYERTKRLARLCGLRVNNLKM